MSFPKLLAAGKSVVGVKDKLSPYRLTDENLLPRFSAEKPPALSAAKPAAAAAAAGEAPEIAPAPAAGGDASATTPSPGGGCLAHTPPSDFLPSSLLSRHAARPGFRSELGRAATWLWGKVWRWPLRAKHGPAQGGLARRAKPLVQAELVLDQVKVVRNDLCDAEGEVVRRRKPGRPGPAAPGPAEPAAASSSWARATARWLGARRA